MTAKEVKHFYKLISETYSREAPNEAEAKSWIEVLAFFKYSDLDAAWRRWQNDTQIEDFTGRPRGARMPRPAELKASIEHMRMLENRGKSRYVTCGQCASGWIDDPERPRYVKRCTCWHEYKRALQEGA